MPMSHHHDTVMFFSPVLPILVQLESPKYSPANSISIRLLRLGHSHCYLNYFTAQLNPCRDSEHSMAFRVYTRSIKTDTTAASHTV